MKRFFLVVCICMFLMACKAVAQKIVSPNNLSEAQATVYLQNGERVSGKVSLNNEVLLAKDIEIKGENPMRLHLLDVKGYERDGQYYELKHTANHIHPRSGFYFMKRLTPEWGTLHVYEHLERKQRGKSIYDAVHVPVYYVQFPDEKLDRVYPSSGKKLVPHFHKKMSQHLALCPALQTKVHDKENGFFYNRMNASENGRKEILLRIAEAYNSCVSTK